MEVRFKSLWFIFANESVPDEDETLKRYGETGWCKFKHEPRWFRRFCAFICFVIVDYMTLVATLSAAAGVVRG